MTAPITQHEWEALTEAEAAFAPEGEWEAEWEGELETGEQFAVGDWARSGWNWLTRDGSPQRRVALAAARAALPRVGTWVGERVGGLAGPEGVPIGAAVGRALGSAGVSLLPDKEWEAEFESEFEAQGEWEGEFEVNPVRKVYLDAMLEHIGHEAAHAESEEEAVESFLPLIPALAGKVLPLAAKMLPKVAGKVIPRLARTVTRVSPHLSRGVTNITRTLYRNPRTRGFLRVVPSIAQRTMHRIVRHAATGRRVTPQTAQRLLAQQTYQVLSHRGARMRALRRHAGMDRRYHGTTGIPATSVMAGGPVGSAGPAWSGWSGWQAGPAMGPVRICPTCGGQRVVGAWGQPGIRAGSRCVCGGCTCEG